MDELINKQEVIDLLMERTSSLRGIHGDLGGACSGAAKLIMQMQSAKPKKGKWIRDGHHIRCDQCGVYMCDTDREGDKIPNNFCPNCGSYNGGEINDQ